MVSEYTILWIAFGSMIGLSLATLLYSLGGRSGKWKRRFIASLILASTLNLAAYFLHRHNFWLFLAYPALIAGFSMGYGADTLPEKIIRRSAYFVANMACGLICALTMASNAWAIVPIHAGIGIWSIYLGVKNPIHAAAEEVFICAVLNLGLMMYPFIS